MKKFLKTFIVCLCLIPCALFMCACKKKDTHVSVNVNGNYTTIAEGDKATIIEKLNNIDTNSNFVNGVEFYTASTINNEDIKITLNLDGTMQGDGDNLIASMSAKIKISNTTMKCNYYVKDNYMYIKMGEQKIKQFLPSSTLASGNFVTLEQIEDIIENSQNPTLSVATSKNTTKYLFETTLANSNLALNYKIYFVFKSDILTGIRYKLTSDYITMDMQITDYSGSIELPNFDDYVLEPDFGMF